MCMQAACKFAIFLLETYRAAAVVRTSSGPLMRNLKYVLGYLSIAPLFWRNKKGVLVDFFQFRLDGKRLLISYIQS